MKASGMAPCLGVKDTAASVAFYEQLGFTAAPGSDNPADDIRVLTWKGAFAFMLYKADNLRQWLPQLKDAPTGVFGMFYLNVPDFDAYTSKIRSLVDVIKEHSDDQARHFYFQDPDGYIIGVAEEQEW
ncbi:glyoxalase/bleomycin resistance/dioxygenase family protein [Streptomyces sp. WZ.A104]|uniref:VOC family protein n=1 Tax=Streptomyces sp. WZ.A104 TaxID=2023771 RepID=UPI000BBBEB05|nr:VOC family protein [Streptomyces sp. WZ.A104]PCG85242.1 glyoxalase/bleomycin resistance/dioxygenase family protein [Streptomyces sp. WZ.A104]